MLFDFTASALFQLSSFKKYSQLSRRYTARMSFFFFLGVFYSPTIAGDPAL